MSDHVFGNKVGHTIGDGASVGGNLGDAVGGDNIAMRGDHSTFAVTKSGPVSGAELEAAVGELREFVDRLRRDGVVAPDGSVTDPGAVVAAVESQPGRLKALATAIAGGAKDAILSVVRDGVAGLVVALVGRM